MQNATIEAIGRNALQKELYKELLPGGRRKGRNWVCGNIDGERGDSFNLDVETGLWNDHSTGQKGKDLVALVKEKEGLQYMSQAAKRVAGKTGYPLEKEYHGAKQDFSKAPLQKQVQQAKADPWQLIPAHEAGVTEAPANHPKEPNTTPAYCWEYRDAAGRFVSAIYRYNLQPPMKGKRFLPLNWYRNSKTGKEEARGTGSWNPRPLYRLEQLAKYPKARILMTEGERAADSAQKLVPELVVSWHGGAQAVCLVDFSPLAGRELIYWPDKDKPGMEAAQEVTRCAYAAGVAKVSIITPPEELPEKGDAADVTPELAALVPGWIVAAVEQPRPRQGEETDSTTPAEPSALLDALEPLAEEAWEEEAVAELPPVLQPLIERTEQNSGAPFQEKTLALLAKVKAESPALWMQTREALKKANHNVVLTDLDKAVKRVQARAARAQITGNPTGHDTSSYPPAVRSFLAEALPGFTDMLTREGDSGTITLLPQSEAAEIISGKIRGRFAASATGGRWFLFAGSHWQICENNLEFNQATTALFYEGCGVEGFGSTYSKQVLEILERSAQNFLPTQAEQAAPGVLPFQNGLFLLAEKRLEQTTPDNALTWCLPYRYDKSATCPRFLQWLDTVTRGNEGVKKLIQGWLFALVTGSLGSQGFLHLIGDGGTGKSTLARLAQVLVGKENYTITTIQALAKSQFETAALYNKRLVILQEVRREDGKKNPGAISIFKSLTGGDSIRLERKYEQQERSFTYTGQTLMTSNEPFSTTDYTGALDRRRLTVEFSRVLTAEEKEAFNKEGGEEALHREAAGIINWLLELTPEEASRILTEPPASVELANFQAARDNAPILEWIGENLLYSPGERTPVGARGEGDVQADRNLYPNYCRWCFQNNHRPTSTKGLSQAVPKLVRHNFKREVMTGGKAGRLPSGNACYLNIRIRKQGEKTWTEAREEELTGAFQAADDLDIPFDPLQ